MKVQLLRCLLPLIFVALLLGMALASQSDLGATRGGAEEKLAKKRQRNAAEVDKLQNHYRNMMDTRRREREQEREAMWQERMQHRPDSYGVEYHEQVARDQAERYKARASADRIKRMSSRSGRKSSQSRGSDESVDDEDDGFSDERATYYMSQIRKKASLVAHHLSLTASHFSSEEIHDLNEQIVNYVALEKKVAAYVQRTADEFNKARDIEDKDTRLKYLNKVKAARQARLPEEKQAREVARDAFLAIRARIDPVLYPRQEL